jgi:hypothetical protein
MTTATDYAGDFFMRLALSEDGLGYPNRVSVVATDVEHVATIVWRRIDEGMPIIVIDGDGGETLISPISRLERLFDRLLRRSRVRVAVRGRDGRTMHRCTTNRATVERELTLP